jgi:aldose sugar dehydrogenase
MSENSPKSSLIALVVGSVVSVAALSNPSVGQTFKSEHGTIKVVTVAKGLENPWSLAFLPDGRMLVTERPGRLRIVSKSGQVGPPVGGVPKVYANGQGGLLDVILDRRYARNRTIYLSYAEPGEAGGGTAVARAVLSGNRLSALKVIFRQQPKSSGGRHFGSRLVHSKDGKLFITVGERGQRSRAQDFMVNRGQVIRINTDGSIPKSNPFIGRKGYRPEIWSVGHRNPQGAALHPITGALWIHEHGARGGDEINIPLAGRNYGWPVIAYGRHYWGTTIGEGTRKVGMEQPIHYWDPSIAPSGMAFYTGSKYPHWKGNLFIGSLKFGILSRLILNGTKIVKEERLLKGLGERIRDVRQGPDGHLYLVTDSTEGRILRLEMSR